MIQIFFLQSLWLDSTIVENETRVQSFLLSFILGMPKTQFIHTAGQFCGLRDRADNILATAAQEISLPTIKTFVSGNELWNVNSLAIVTGNMDHWDDRAHLTDAFKQKNTLIAVAGSMLLSRNELNSIFRFSCENSLSNGGINALKELYFYGWGVSRLPYSIFFNLFILEKSNWAIYW